jgi:hypothetical protein
LALSTLLFVYNNHLGKIVVEQIPIWKMIDSIPVRNFTLLDEKVPACFFADTTFVSTPFCCPH